MSLPKRFPKVSTILTTLLMLVVCAGSAQAVQVPGSGPRANESVSNLPEIIENPSRDIPNGHVSLIFTVADVVFFSYSDGTLFELYDSSDNLIWDNGGVPIDAGGHAEVTGISGTFKAVGSQTFTVLSGDPITNSVCGYFAMDAGGFGTGTEFFTWVPALYDHAEFVVFGYHDNTEVTVYYTDTGDVVDSFMLNDGEHWNMSTLDAEWLHVVASQPVSVLTGYDQGYFVPADDGLWTGTKFHTYVSDTGGWGADLTVICYEDNTSVTIINSDTLAPVWNGVLNSGQVHVESFPSGSGEYFTITTDNTCAVSCQPWVTFTSNYHQGAYVPDRTGSGVGTNFIGSSLGGGVLEVLAYRDGTSVDIYDAATDTWIAEYMLNAGESVNANPGNGMWRVRSNRIVSCYSGWGTWSADFAPVEFAETINPLNLTKTDGFQTGECVLNGDEFDYTICYDNTENDIPVTEVVLVDTLPMEVEFLAASDGGVYDGDSHTVTWDIGSLDQGDAGACVTVTVRVGDDLNFLFFVNIASISSAETGTQNVTETTAVCESVGAEMPTPLVVVQTAGVTLSWHHNGGLVDGYNIYRRTTMEEPQQVNATLVPDNVGQITFTDRPAMAGRTTLLYSYAPVVDGQEQGRSAEVEVVWDGGLPSATALLGNYPNPFNPNTTIKFNLGESGDVTLAIYDLSGRRVAVLHDGQLPAGPHERVWSGMDDRGRPMPSGTYHYRLQANGQAWIEKMTLVK